MRLPSPLSSSDSCALQEWRRRREGSLDEPWFVESRRHHLRGCGEGVIHNYICRLRPTGLSHWMREKGRRERWVLCLHRYSGTISASVPTSLQCSLLGVFPMIREFSRPQFSSFSRILPLSPVLPVRTSIPACRVDSHECRFVQSEFPYRDKSRLLRKLPPVPFLVQVGIWNRPKRRSKFNELSFVQYMVACPTS